jgi:hypothetical protein
MSGFVFLPHAKPLALAHRYSPKPKLRSEAACCVVALLGIVPELALWKMLQQPQYWQTALMVRLDAQHWRDSVGVYASGAHEKPQLDSLDILKPDPS